MLANALLTKINGSFQVALLDLDPGQPEFSPPGEISLIRLLSCNFGPPFSHPTPAFSRGDHLIRAHHIGAVTPKDDPDHYVRCALDLWGHYRRMLELHPSCPLIVNCSGWVQGTGLEVLQELICCMNLTNVIYTSMSGPTEVIETLVKTAHSAKSELHILPSQPSNIATRTAADLRMMQTLSYFHLDEPEGGNLRWNPAPLTEIAPLTVHYAGFAQAIYGIMVLGEKQDVDNVMTILLGCVVAVVIIEDDLAITMHSGASDDLPMEDSDDDQSKDEQATEGMQGSRISSDVRTDSQYRARVDLSGDSDSDTYLHHDFISRTPEGLPYLCTKTGLSTPLDPSKSRSLGQALVRGIDSTNKTLQLITPIPVSTLQALHQQKFKIVLVRGKLDTPTWAYREELVASVARRKRRKDENGEPQRLTPHEIREWAEGIPWAHVVDGREVKGPGAKVWRIKRHLRNRGEGSE